MSNTETAAERYAATIAAELREWRAAITDPDGEEYATITREITPDDGDGEPLTWADYINAVALDVEVMRPIRDGDGRDRLRIEILRTYGGPGCVIVADDRYSEEWVYVEAYSAGDPDTEESVYCPELCEWLAEVYA
jgi:hypothetical protein